MPTEEELFAAVDELLAGEPGLPEPAERARLREAAGVTQARLAAKLSTSTQTIKNWESGRAEPRPPRRGPYIRLLEAWAERYPAPGSAPQAPASGAPAAGTPDAPPPSPIAAPAAVPAQQAAAPAAPAPPSAAEARPPASRRPPAGRTDPASAPAADPRFPHGPLLVLDGDGSAYGAGGLVLDCPATTVSALVAWTLSEAGIGAGRLHRHGKDADPLVVLTAAAAERFGLPGRLEDRRGLRLPEDHPVVEELARAEWKLTRRGFGPWPRIYRPVAGRQRQCVQLAVLPWEALDARAWGEAADLPAPELARVLATYAARVLTPRGSAATSGLELMSALRPPTKPAPGPDGTWVPAPSPGALTAAVDPVPPEAPVEHPVAQGWEGGFLDEEAYQWVRPMETLTDEECLHPCAVGLDINTAFLAAASRLTVGLGEPVHRMRPIFDKKVPGTWYVDLSHVEVDPRLPSPFTPSGQRPAGPAWYVTATVAYAVELGFRVRPLEAYLRPEAGAYLDPWHDRLRDAYVATMADLRVPTGTRVEEREFLAAMEEHKLADPGMAMVLSAVKSTVKGGIGKLRERPQGRHYREGDRWPALERPTWRPDIRAAVISKARTNMHRKMAKTAAATGRYPLAVLSDCVVYPSPGDCPLDFLPLTDDGHVLPGSFRLGAAPGMAKLEGVQAMIWAVELMDQGLNPARHIKGGDAVLDEGE